MQIYITNVSKEIQDLDKNILKLSDVYRKVDRSCEFSLWILRQIPYFWSCTSYSIHFYEFRSQIAHKHAQSINNERIYLYVTHAKCIKPRYFIFLICIVNSISSNPLLTLQDKLFLNKQLIGTFIAASHTSIVRDEKGNAIFRMAAWRKHQGLCFMRPRTIKRNFNKLGKRKKNFEEEWQTVGSRCILSREGFKREAKLRFLKQGVLRTILLDKILNQPEVSAKFSFIS